MKEIVRLRPKHVDHVYGGWLVDMAVEFNKHLGFTASSLEKVQNGLKSIVSHPNYSAIFLSLIDGKPAGFIYANLGHGLSAGGMYIWINGVYVQPDARGHKVGLGLMEAAISWGRKQGSIYAIALRHHWNEPSQKLFAKLGFD